MHFVTVEKNDKSAPSGADMKKAMTDSGGTPIEVTGDNAARKLTFTGTVNHNTYQNNLRKVADGKQNSWNFVWADAAANSSAA
ncbi:MULTISPECIES: hypothetical protein [Pseudomonas]|uniref:Uncharacterized protein n=1 Tax=Pseudomonas izuensis TaxID=2684212 RepID=A0ABM7RW13_9PSED|nr:MULTISPECIES: hypothetical protein [Pseudomonas]RKS27983.1 hypothetical protein BJ917_0844 [Pseudomonas sp. WPR_5_2]BCX68697.1 hypothetical protein LAB08_R33390 [Pseudomonas izuensis]